MLKPYIHPLHFHKPYLIHLKTNFSDFYGVECAKEGVTKTFQCSKVMDQCGKKYKTLFTKVFHMLVYLTILKLQYVLL